MSRFDGDRLDDINAAIDAIRSHLRRGGLEDDLVLDAVRVRLIEIGEAVKALSPDLTGTEPEIPWRQIARMRDHLAHRYFATEVVVIRSTVNDDLGELAASVERLRRRLEG
ncbi:MAG: HepT-like ribonuclease domain-containing protein [Nocardioidaceae bacterium]